LETALDNISNIFLPKRKRIFLDKNEINDIVEKHVGTVELLNEYLENDKEEIHTTNKLIEPDTSELEISLNSIISKRESFIFSDLQLSEVQEKLIQMIVENSFKIPQNDVEKYALKNGHFKNQIIDNINELCADYINGEALIEEDEDNYIIDEAYYKEIAVK
jgi:hypothetical protein